MEAANRFCSLCALNFLLWLTASFAAEMDNLRTYIIQLHPGSYGGGSASNSELLHKWQLSLVGASMSESRILYTYQSAMDGFAARLSECEVATLRKSPEVIAIRPDRKLQVQTTYSFKFLGLSSSASGPWARSAFGRGTIIGVLDTGVWPESPSFNDRSMPPPPKRWKGVCQQGQDFNSTNCNRKLIGARWFTRGHHVAASTAPSLDSRNASPEYISPRDSHGHGTHTTSTAAGVPVPMASVFGNGAGEARGMAPGAHIAVYKVCWLTGCYSSDILAAMDAAIRDGVDVLSLSLGGFPIPLYDDSIAIGSFRAMEHGISVVCAAGNNGPIVSSVSNGAPWIVTVGASTLDRQFPALIRMGNRKYLYGESMYPGNQPHKAGSDKEIDVVYIAGGENRSQFCIKGSLPRDKVHGKMVVCDRGENGRAEKGQVVKEAGGAAMVLANMEVNKEEDSVDVHILPATQIGAREAALLKAYINSTARPTARIVFGGTVIGKSRAPSVAWFSSRGPSLTDPGILKPDVIAPGVNIIAAWPQNLGPSSLPEDRRRVNFTVMSGTSMACPHVSGLAAMVRSAHPGWSPAAIKSAIMTTADLNDHSGKPIMDGDSPAQVFAMGAGQVNPPKAVDPGLIYDITPDDYITHLCTLGYKSSDISTVTHRNISCREVLRTNQGFSLNYPSISVRFEGGATRKMVRRRVTNVGEPRSVYKVEVIEPEGVLVRVRPKRLVFRRRNQVLGYRVWFISPTKNGVGGASSEGQLTWVNTRHRVRSPIAVTWKQS